MKLEWEEKDGKIQWPGTRPRYLQRWFSVTREHLCNLHVTLVPCLSSKTSQSLFRSGGPFSTGRVDTGSLSLGG